MAKKITRVLKLQVPAGQANPAPPIGSALGPFLNIMDFCKTFNAKTQKMEQGMPVPTVVTVYQDRSFTFETKTPPASYYIKKLANVKKGASNPGRDDNIATISEEKVKEIATLKMEDLNAYNIEAAMQMIRGSARSMGITVTD